MVYLNHAGTSWPKPEAVRDATAAALAAEPETWTDAFAAQHQLVARSFGVADPTRLLLTPGCTAAIAAAVSDLPWQPGDRLVTSAWEHHALIRPVLQLAARGVEHVAIPPAGDAPLDLRALESTLRDRPVRLVAVCAAANTTGARLPLEAIVPLAHAHGALVLVDAAQTAGWDSIDVARLGADMLAFAGHKGPQAPWGVGGLYVAPEVALTPPGASCELGASDACAPMPGYCDTGSVDRAALAGLAAGLSWLDAPARADRVVTAREHIERLAAALRPLGGIELRGPADAAERVPTLAFTVAGRRADEVAGALAARGVLASGGHQCAPLAHATLGTAAAGVVRLSVGPSTRDDHIARAIDVLRAELG